MSEAALIMKDKTPRVVWGPLECGGKRSATPLCMSQLSSSLAKRCRRDALLAHSKGLPSSYVSRVPLLADFRPSRPRLAVSLPSPSTVE